MRFGRRIPSSATWCFLVAAAIQSGDDVATHRKLAAAHAAAGRHVEAVAELRKVTELAPKQPGGWYALGQAYNAIKQDAIGSFRDGKDNAPWRLLIAADSLLQDGKLTDAFTLYRAVFDRLPAMVSIHDAVAAIYERTGHTAWAERERAAGKAAAADCAVRKALCEFRAGRYESALAAALDGDDPESRYWRARAAAELALAAFRRLEDLDDSPERRSVRATLAKTEERYTDAIAELQAALRFVPNDPTLVYELASSYYLARDYEQAVATIGPLLSARPDDPRLLKLLGYSLLQSRRLEEAMPVLRRAVERDPSDPGPRLALGRALVQNGDFAAAIPLIEPELEQDRDGSLHVQLARAYSGLGQRDKAAALLARSQELQRAAEARNAANSQRTITGPK
jgi:predicted Zn-dependent protease